MQVTSNALHNTTQFYFPSDRKSTWALKKPPTSQSCTQVTGNQATYWTTKTGFHGDDDDDVVNTTHAQVSSFPALVHHKRTCEQKKLNLKKKMFFLYKKNNFCLPLADCNRKSSA